MSSDRLRAALIGLALLGFPAVPQADPAWSGGSFHDGVPLQAADLNNGLATRLQIAGGTLTGELTLGPSTTAGAPLNCPAGAAPTTPANNDIWCTASGVFVQLGGSTMQLGSSSGPVTTFNTRSGAVVLTLSDVTTALAFTPLNPANNLSDLTNAGLAQVNLGLGSAALLASSAVAQTANNLSDLASASAARTNLGLGGAATLSVGTAAGTVAAGNDSRFSGPTQNTQAASYTLVLADAGREILHPSSDASARTYTIPANGSVAYAVGTKIEIVNDCSAGVITLAITTDTLEWFSSGSTGSRTLAACAMGTLTKITSTKWALVGIGIS